MRSFVLNCQRLFWAATLSLIPLTFVFKSPARQDLLAQLAPSFSSTQMLEPIQMGVVVTTLDNGQLDIRPLSGFAVIEHKKIQSIFSPHFVEVTSREKATKADLPLRSEFTAENNAQDEPLFRLEDAFADMGFDLPHKGFSSPIGAQVINASLPPQPLIPQAKENTEQSFERMKRLSIRNDKDFSRAQYCLSEAIYFESRGEPEKGQKAVAQVVLNRVKSGFYPHNVCDVVYQNMHRRNACQFSYACDGIPERIRDAKAWQKAKEIADDALNGRYFLSDIGDATHYHANWVWPDWRHELKKQKKIGVHIFYKMPKVQINDLKS